MMKVYKKICSLILSLLIVFSTFNFTFSVESVAAVAPKLSLTNQAVTVGETVTVPVVIDDSDEVFGGNFTLQYDSNLLEVESFTYGDIVSGHTKNCNLDYQSAGNLIRFTFSGASALSSDGTLVTFTFTARAAGEAELQFNACKMYDENGSSMTVTTGSAMIKIIGVVESLPEISIASQTVEVGETVTVPVVIKDSGNVFGGNFTLQYDSDLLEVESYTYGDIVSGHTKNCNLDYQSVGNLIRFTFSGATALSSDGTLVTFTFIAKASGTANIKFNAYKMYDENGTSISAVASNGTITVEPKKDNIVTGQCGDNVYYELDIDSGKLIISGTGAMWDFTTFNAPWYENYADSIKTIEIQDSVTTIGSAAFSYCYYLTDVKFGNGLKHIGSGAFSHSSNLLSVVLPYGVESIGDWAFEYCNDLAEIILPDTIKSIGKNICDVTAFHENEANWSGNVLYIGKHLVDTKFPYTGECIIKDGTLTIADSVFYQSNLTSVTIPNSVTNIGKGAFGCTDLTSVTIPGDVKEIKTDTFYHCLSLERVTLTNGTEIIGSSAFYYCPNLTTITIPISVTYIGEAAFVLCDNLKTVIYNGSQYGSQDDWNLIEICDNNDELLKVKPQTFIKVIDSIEINNNPTKTNYYVGDTLDTSGLTITAIYNNGTTKMVSSGFTCTPTTLNTAGTQKITVAYGGKTTSFDVTVEDVVLTDVSVVLRDLNGNIVIKKDINGDATEYTFEGIEDGEYTVTISKETYASREYIVTATDGKAEVEFKLNHTGDINGDGKVSLVDYTQLLRHVKKTSTLDGYAFDCADVNGDGKLSVLDYTKLLRHVKKTEMLW